MEFLSLNPEAFGMDFSDLRLRIVKLEKRGKFFDLVSWNEKAIPEGIIKDGEILDREKLALIIKNMVDKARGRRIAVKYVVASLPEQKAFLQVIKVPKMEKDELKTAIPFEIENYIPVPVDQVYLDYELISPEFSNTKNLDVLIGAMSKNIVDSYSYCIKEAGLIPKALEVESQSIARVLIKNHVSSSPILIIDFGKSTTSFIVFSGRSLRFTSSIDMSSQKLTQAISQELGKTLGEAEKLKLKYGLEVSDKSARNKKVVEVMNPLIIDLIKQTKKYIDYYHTHSNNMPISEGGGRIEKVLLCGGGSNLKGLSKFISRELGIKAEIANPWINIFPELNKKIPKISFKESLGYTTALGLALRGIQEEI